ncbi:MAG TPA: aminotransferase class V-fold PLP-dependent enzyme [Sedimenticola thiotaurini]|uniref:Aminotransferase class V-fold PLP-dependent enzyme n=1 Tax=Sedimenticola thiotaurini TaxID=1543721 RepID=A0A831RLD3_9GAMM|nr:aminotransferase class V-fold PLP-dependent enzyme [Sedimenticola thiotaurini]
MTPDVTDLDWLRSQIIGVDATIHTPFGARPMLYADYTASGRGLHFVEGYLRSLLPLYANSHTEDDVTGRITTALLHQAEERIKSLVNAGPDGRIIAFGTGATGAIDRMQQLLGVKLPAASRALLDALLEGFLGQEQASAFRRYRESHQPVVFVGPYEHHSNEISWRESLCTVVEVQMTADGAIDLEHLESLLQEPAFRDRLRIGSFSAASNVTGMISPVPEIAALLHRHDALALFDYAASAPYVPIDMNPGRQPGDHLDAVFISPHKFLGGPGASGLLVFNKRCYRTDLPPSMAGGGTVEYVGPEDHDFLEDIEEREKAGTPGILQTIRAALVMELKQAIGFERIEQRERAMVRQAFERWQAHPGIEILGNQDPERRVGIVSLNVRDPEGQYLHPRFVTTLLNDLFGIQSRAGCSCAGPYGHKLLDISPVKAAEYRSWITRGYHGVKPGWCRVGFHFAFDQAEVDYLLECMEFVADHGHRFVHRYHFDAHSGSWTHREWRGELPTLSLQRALEPVAGSSPLTQEQRRQRYRDALDEARDLAEDSGSG